MPMYNLIKFTKNYLKTLVSLWQYYRDKPILDVNGTTIDFSPPANNNSLPFKFR